MKRRIHLMNVGAVVLLLAGCMGYRLGGSGPEGIKTVTVASIINSTSEPAIELQVAHALRKRLQFDGRLKLVNSTEAADAIIETTLIQYNLTPIAYQKRELTTPQQYRLSITGVATLKDSKTDGVLSASSTYGEATFDFQSDLTTSKRNALPIAAEELAKFMIDDLIERWQ